MAPDLIWATDPVEEFCCWGIIMLLVGRTNFCLVTQLRQCNCKQDTEVCQKKRKLAKNESSFCSHSRFAKNRYLEPSSAPVLCSYDNKLINNLQALSAINKYPIYCTMHSKPAFLSDMHHVHHCSRSKSSQKAGQTLANP